jgi:hypothetical protein
VDLLDDDFDCIITKLDITVLPTFVFYFNGKAIDRISGSNPIILKRKSKYLSMLNQSQTRLNNDENEAESKNDNNDEINSCINKSISEFNISTATLDKKIRKCKKNLLKSKSELSIKIENFYEVKTIQDYSKHTLNCKAIVMWTAKWYFRIDNFLLILYLYINII